MIRKSAVIGAGVMGSGIALHLASAGCEVVLIDNDTTQLSRAANTITDKSVRFSNDLSDSVHADYVIEAITEDLGIKKRLFRDLSKVVPTATIIASNTSSLLIRDLAKAVQFGERFLGVHYNNPAEFNPIVEIIPSPATPPELTKQLQQWYGDSGKEAICCQDTSGFILNRQSLPYINEAARCLGIATAGTIDAIARHRLGVELGPFAVMNLVGLKVMALASKNLEILGPGYATASALQKKSADYANSWDLDDTDPIKAKVSAEIGDRLLGAMLFPGRDILDKELCSPEDLDLICKKALGYKHSSVELLQELPTAEVDRLIASFRSSETD